MISRASFIPVFFLMMLGMVVCAVQPAHSQVAATGEDVAIAFFKTGETNPDFDMWAKSSRDYRVAPPVRADEVLHTEKQRLMQKWRDYDTKESVLNITAMVSVELKTITNKDGSEQYWMYIVFPQGEVTYFPYKYLKYDLAVIPQQIESLMIQPLPKDQYMMIRTNLGDTTGANAYLSMQLKPTKAYLQQPYIIDNKEQWALMCDVATMSLLSYKTKQVMWTYSADWYVSPVTQQLRDLYQAPAGAAVPSTPSR